MKKKSILSEYSFYLVIRLGFSKESYHAYI